MNIFRLNSIAAIVTLLTIGLTSQYFSKVALLVLSGGAIYLVFKNKSEEYSMMSNVINKIKGNNNLLERLKNIASDPIVKTFLTGLMLDLIFNKYIAAGAFAAKYFDSTGNAAAAKIMNKLGIEDNSKVKTVTHHIMTFIIVGGSFLVLSYFKLGNITYLIIVGAALIGFFSLFYKKYKDKINFGKFKIDSVYSVILGWVMSLVNSIF